MTVEHPKVLLIGYGNPGRLDDGLGPALAEAIEALNLPGVTVQADYQLTVEDAAAVAEHDVAIFADADVAGEGPFYFRRLTPLAGCSFTSHSVEPAALLALAVQLFDARASAYVLGIRGYEFNEFDERLSEGATRNLAAALEYLRTALLAGRFSEVGNPPVKQWTEDTAPSMGN